MREPDVTSATLRDCDKSDAGIRFISFYVVNRVIHHSADITGSPTIYSVSFVDNS